MKNEDTSQTRLKPFFISMAELSCATIIKFIFENHKGSKDRLYDILKRGAPHPTSKKCTGRHHPACTATYGCIGERRLLLPGQFAIWLAEAEEALGIEISAGDKEILVNKRSLT